MAREHVEGALKVAEAKQENGWSVLAEGRSLSLYVAKDGATLNITRIEAVAFEEPLLRARTTSGEVFVVTLSEVFAAAATGSVAKTKKAGFAAGG
ncbi:MAG TPA: hypothetical protein VHO25_17270 [Polyangiaceae bacterium]|jgi:hypothetical protein|nr:hypothetical protein [Polyangiaceae bacterium]